MPKPQKRDFSLKLTRVIEPTGGPGVELARLWRTLPDSWGVYGPGGRHGRTGIMRRSWCSLPRPRRRSARTDQSTASVNSLIRIKFHGCFFVGMVLCAVLVESRNMAKAPRQLVLTSPQFEPLTLGPLRYRNDATSREQAISKHGRARIIKFRTDGMITIIDRRLPSRRSQVEAGNIRIAEPRAVRNCAFSDLTVRFMAS